MKSFKKLLAVVLSLAMVLGSLTVTALAAEPTEVSTFEELQTAIAAGGEIKLTADITDMSGTPINVTAGSVTIDLNGHKADRSAGQGGNVIAVAEGATLTIKDTSESGNGYVGMGSAKSTSNSSPISVSGTLNLESGAIKYVKSTSTSAKVINIPAGGVFNIKGGTLSNITASATSGSYYGILVAGTLNISGGLITKIDTSGNKRPAIQANTDGVINISGGEITGNTIASTGSLSSDIRNYAGYLNISGDAMINGKILSESGAKETSITGGWFSAQPTASWIPEGYKWVADTTTKPGYAGYVTEGTTPKVAEVTIGTETTQYETYDAAIAAAAATETAATIKLLDDCEKTEKVTTIAAGKSVTLDLNGHALTNTHDVTIEQSGAASTNNRYFNVKGTLTITDSSSDKTGSMTVNDAFTLNGGITQAEGGTVYVTGGNFFTGDAQTPSTNNCWLNKSNSGGTHAITGGWFAEYARPTNNTSYVASGYSTIEVTDESKSATPYTVTNTFKTINYYKNSADASGTVEPAKEYYLEGYTTAPVYAKTNQYSLKGYSFMGWSTDSQADPDTDPLVAPGDVIDLTKYTGDTIDFYAIWKKVDVSMWVCVKTGDPTTGYADLAAALAAEDDVTLIKNITDRTTITASGTINLNGYNIVPTATGSALVIKAAVSIKNEDAGPITVGEIEYKFGGEGKVQGTAQGTGGAIEAAEGATVKIYGGTFTGDAPTHGTVLTCSKTGVFLIYGGTFAPLNAESEVDAYYANNSKIYVIPEKQSDVKMTGTFAKNTSGEAGIQGGYFSDLQPAAVFGTYDAMQGEFKAVADKALVANTGVAEYPYSVSDAWKITYSLNGGENDPANPETIAKTDDTVITLQPATKDGYTFSKWTDAEGNEFTTLKGTELTADLELTANYDATVYNITYDNLYGATNPNPATYTIEDDITLTEAVREGTNWYFSKWTLTDGEGDQVTGWKAGEKTGDITLWANWSGYTAEVNGEKCKTIDDAVEAAKLIEETVTIKILKDFSLTSRINLKDALSSDFVLDLNGKKITKKDFTESGIIVYSGDLTIKGNGTVIDNSTNGATAKARTIVCQRAGATLTIEGGTFEKFVKSTSNASSTEGQEGAGATIVAGTFSFNPSEDTTSTLKEGSVFEETEAPFKVYVAAASVTTEGTTTFYKFTKSSTKEKSALDNIDNGSVMKLYKDAEGKQKFDTNMTFTINLNGFKYEKVDTEAGTTEKIDDLLTAAEGHEIFFATEGDIITVTIKNTVTYAITYDVGEGTNDPANPATYTETTKTFALKDAIPNDEAYSFQGWYDDATAGNRVTEIAKGSSGDLTLYARYSNTAVATVMVDGVKKNYVSISAAIAAAIANQKDGVATVTLTGNDLDDTITVKDAPCKVVFDFDGKEVNAAAGKEAMSITNSVVNFNNGKIIIYKPIYVNENAICLTSGVNVTKGDGYEGSSMFESKGIILFGGVVLTVSPIVNQTASAASLSEFAGSLSDSINPEVFFYFAQKAGSTDVPTIKVVSPNGTEILAAEDLGDGKYSAKLTSLTPNQLAEEIEITPMVGDTAIGNTYKTTMLKYFTELAETEIAKGESADESLLNLIADTIKYGSELQKYMKEGEAFDVPSILTSYVTTVTPVEGDSVKATTTSAVDAQNYLIKSASLNIDVKVSAFFVVYSTDSTAKLNITVNGETQSFTLSECPVVTSMGNNFYRVQSKALSALDYSRTITVTLTDSTGTTTYHAITYSVNSYCYSMSAKTVASSALTAAIFRYGKSGVAYINNGARYRY